MSRIRWYLDEDAMARALVRGLQARGIDVTTAFDAGMAGRDDEQQLEHATRLGRVIFTFNFTFNVDDFCRLHAAYQDSGRKHSGIVVAHRRRFTLGELVHGLARLSSEVSAEEMVGRRLFLKV